MVKWLSGWVLDRGKGKGNVCGWMIDSHYSLTERDLDGECEVESMILVLGRWGGMVEWWKGVLGNLYVYVVVGGWREGLGKGKGKGQGRLGVDRGVLREREKDLRFNQVKLEVRYFIS